MNIYLEYGDQILSDKVYYECLPRLNIIACSTCRIKFPSIPLTPMYVTSLRVLNLEFRDCNLFADTRTATTDLLEMLKISRASINAAINTYEWVICGRSINSSEDRSARISNSLFKFNLRRSFLDTVCLIFYSYLVSNDYDFTLLKSL